MRDLYGKLLPFFQAGEDNGGSSNDTPGTGNTGESKTFSQEEVNQIVAQRLQRESAKYSDYDQIKANYEKLQAADKERQEAEMDEVEKLKAQSAEKDALIKDLQAHKEWRENWTKSETEAIEKEMEGLSDEQKTLVRDLTLDKRRALIGQFKASAAQPKGASFGKNGGGIDFDKPASSRKELDEKFAEFYKAQGK